MEKETHDGSRALAKTEVRNLPATRPVGSELLDDPDSESALDIRSVGKNAESDFKRLYSETSVSSGLRLGFWTICLLLGSFLVWASQAQLDEVASAAGEVIPLGETKVIQHLEGGIIEEVFVSEGQVVEAGDSLVRLNVSATAANKIEAESNLDSQLVLQARLEAEVQNLERPAFPEVIALRRPDLAATELANFAARRDEFAGRLRILDQRIRQRQLEIREYEVTEKTLNTDMELMKEKMEISEELLEQGNLSRIQYVQTRAEFEALAGRLDVLTQSIPRAESALTQARAERSDEESRFRTRALEELARVQRDIGSLTERLSRATEQETRSLITSPITGYIKDIRFKTIGGVVRPGEPMMDIVPTEDALVVTARLQPIDRGYVEINQRAEVKISTYDFARYGSLSGRVERISATTTTDQTQQTFFEVIVSTEKTYLGDEPGLYQISPGMQATIDIHTGTRTVLDFLVRPVLKLRHEAFRER